MKIFQPIARTSAAAVYQRFRERRFLLFEALIACGSWVLPTFCRG
ncbi:hypothetical protein [Xanthomonas medicagonis]